MRKLCALLTLICLCMFLGSCKVETVEQHEANNFQVSSIANESSEIVNESSESVIESQTDFETVQSQTPVTTTPVTTPLPTTSQKQNKTTTQKKTEQSKTSMMTTVATTLTTEKKSLSVSITIDCSDAFGKLEKNIELPSSGYFLKNKEIKISDGDTVFDVIKKACDGNGIKLDYTGKPKLKTVYITGVGGLYEKDCGSESGWKYKIDGVIASVSCSGLSLHGGENIVFYYTTKVNG